MMIKVNAKLFAQALNALEKIVPRRSPKPVLHSVLVSARADVVDLLANNMEQWACIQVGRESSMLANEDEVPFLLSPDARRFIGKCAGDVSLDFDAEAGRVTIRSGRDKGAFGCEDVTLFPTSEVSWEREGASAFGKAKDIHALAERCGKATEPESTRYALGGIAIERGEAGLRGIATDGRRLACLETGYAALTGWDFPQPAVVPLAWFSAAKAMIEAETESHLFVDGNSIRIIGDGAQVWSRLVEGRFPRWKDVLPTEFSAECVAGQEEWLAALAKCQIACRDDDTTQGVNFAKTGDVMELTAQNEGREVTTEVVITTTSELGDVKPCVFDPEYFADGVNGVGPVVRMEWPADDKSALRMTDPDRRYQYVIMPLTRDR